jgi:TRAP-type C4-dicarboxylate transport system substrate-binding protein
VRRLYPWVALLCSFGVAAAAPPGPAARIAVRTVQLNEPAPAGSPQDIALRRFKRSVESATHGEVSIDVHLDGGLGNPTASVENMMFGDLEMFSSKLTDYLPLMIDEVSGVATPFLLDSVDATRAYIKTPLLDEGREKVLHSRRIRYLEMSAIRQPFDVIASRRQLASIDSLAGLRMTSTAPLTKSAVRIWAALGVTYVPPMTAPQTRAALAAGRVDAIIVPDLKTIANDRLERLAPYLVGVDDCPQVWQISINEILWGHLSADDQAALRKAADDSARLFENQAERDFQAQIAQLTSRTHTRFAWLDASAIRRRLLPTYQALVDEGALNPRVLATANAAVADVR